jgi:enoyl-CoA hydratase
MSAEQAPAFTVEHEDILTVTLNEPRRRNAISPAVTEMLWQALDSLIDRDDLRCLMITSTGSFFSSGIDLRFGAGHRRGLPQSQPPWNGWQYRRNYRSHHRLYDEIEAVEKPVVLAAPGPVIGAGMEMALSCDFRFCTPNAYWHLPEVTLGAIAGSGGISRLTRTVGPHWARWIAMAAKPIDANQALQIGLVHAVYPEENFLEDVRAFCRGLTALPSEAVGLSKLAIDLADSIGGREEQRNVDRIANTTLRVRASDFEERTSRFRGPTEDSTGQERGPESPTDEAMG